MRFTRLRRCGWFCRDVGFDIRLHFRKLVVTVVLAIRPVGAGAAMASAAIVCINELVHFFD
jgi:hypothetical protein